MRVFQLLCVKRVTAKLLFLCALVLTCAAPVSAQVVSATDGESAWFVVDPGEFAQSAGPVVMHARAGDEPGVLSHAGVLGSMPKAMAADVSGQRLWFVYQPAEGVAAVRSVGLRKKADGSMALSGFRAHPPLKDAAEIISVSPEAKGSVRVVYVQALAERDEDAGAIEPGAGTIRIALLAQNRWIEAEVDGWADFAQLDRLPQAKSGEASATRAGRTLTVWAPGYGPATSTGASMWVRETSAAGGSLYDGFVLRPQVVTPAAAATIAIVLSVLLAGGLLMCMPWPALRRNVSFPDNVALADPARRIFAAIADWMPGFYISSAIFARHAETGEDLFASLFWLNGPWPIVVYVLINLVHTTACEMLYGRTIGKLMANCRTVAAGGRTPTLAQALVRSGSKLILPVLVASLLVQPWRQRPGAAGTFVVIDLEPEDDAPDSASGPRGRQRSQQGHEGSRGASRDETSTPPGEPAQEQADEQLDDR